MTRPWVVLFEILGTVVWDAIERCGCRAPWLSSAVAVERRGLLVAEVWGNEHPTSTRELST